MFINATVRVGADSLRPKFKRCRANPTAISSVTMTGDKFVFPDNSL
jgi:hypothetical protein